MICARTRSASLRWRKEPAWRKYWVVGAAACSGLRKPEQAAAPTTQYFLQAGSFRQRSEADRVRAQIILMGLDARLEDAKLANGEVWHRVQVGPFPDQSRLAQAERTLSGNGFSNLLRQQRSVR